LKPFFSPPPVLRHSFYNWTASEELKLLLRLLSRFESFHWNVWALHCLKSSNLLLKPLFFFWSLLCRHFPDRETMCQTWHGFAQYLRLARVRQTPHNFPLAPQLFFFPDGPLYQLHSFLALRPSSRKSAPLRRFIFLPGALSLCLSVLHCLSPRARLHTTSEVFSLLILTIFLYSGSRCKRLFTHCQSVRTIVPSEHYFTNPSSSCRGRHFSIIPGPPPSRPPAA